MIDYKNRSLKKEILDQKNIPFGDIVLNMKELEFINSHLRGHSITISGFKKLVKNKRDVSVCEIGCGGGDNLKAIDKFSKRKHIICSFTGIDINKECIAFAKENMQSSRLSFISSPTTNIKFIVSDYKYINFKNEKPDVIFSSLFCHHFSENELIDMLHWMKMNSRIGFFINDLHRHPVAYHFIKIATKIFSKSCLVKNDAPLSVLRGFKKNEWKNIFEKAGIKNYSIRWKWAFRYLVVVSNEQNQ